MNYNAIHHRSARRRNTNAATVLANLIPAVDYCERTPWIEGYSWFMSRITGDTNDSLLASSSGVLTPADANAPDDERHMLWFDVMKPMTSTAAGREVAHLREFHAYAAHSQELALHRAYGAADPEAQRPAVEDFLYWRYVAGLLENAITATS